VAVQYGHVIGSRIHNAQDWCIYVKGGSAEIRVEGNRIYTCGTGGFTAGQGTGLQFMASPWLHYEAYDVRVLNNLIYDTEGAGLGVNGGYNILLAYNTLYRVGSRSHLLEVGYGSRSCDGQPGDAGREACGQNLAAGGWGTTVVDDGSNYVRIPNRNVFIYNNLIVNPAGYRSQYQQLFIPAAYGDQPGTNLPAGAAADSNLVIRGNLIWNGPADMPLGVEDSAGCADGNPTCSAAQLRAENTINAAEPELADPTGGDLRPAAGSAALGATTYAIPSFPGGDMPGSPLAPAGELGNQVARDLGGAARGAGDPPGAYASASFVVTTRVFLPAVRS
jgi:hypothetical protein